MTHELDMPPDRALVLLDLTDMPCPFKCGMDGAPYLYRPKGVLVWTVRHICGAEGPAHHDAEDSVNAWNERST